MNIKFGSKKTGSNEENEKRSNVAWRKESDPDAATVIPTVNIRIQNRNALVKLVNFIPHSKNTPNVLIGRFDDDDQWPNDDEMDSAPAAVDRGLTGEEAYKRRLAMSAGSKPREPSPPPPIVGRTLTGDEAYQRRLAMSTGLKLHESTPSSIGDAEDSIPGLTIDTEPLAPQPSTAGEEAYLRRIAMSTMGSKPPPAAIASPSPPPLAYNPFAPPAVPSPPTAAPPAAISLEEKVKAAAAIAAKLSALGKSDITVPSASPTPPPASSEDKR